NIVREGVVLARPKRHLCQHVLVRDLLARMTVRRARRRSARWTLVRGAIRAVLRQAVGAIGACVLAACGARRQRRRCPQTQGETRHVDRILTFAWTLLLTCSTKR